MILEWLRQTIYARKLTEDIRTIETHALLTLEVPTTLGSLWGADEDDATMLCALIPPEFGFYYQLVASLFLQSCFNALLGACLYKIVIEPRNQKQQQPQKEPGRPNGHGETPPPLPRVTIEAWLFSLAIALPCVILQPIYAVRALEIQNLGLIMVFLATPIVNSLRITEALYGFAPHPETQSLRNYVVYFSCCFGLKFDPTTGKPRRVTWAFLKNKIQTLLRDFAIVSTVICILRPYQYEFFAIPHHGPSVDSMDHTLLELFSWRHLGNNFLVAFLISAQLSQSTIGVGIIYSLVYGIESYEVVLNPMLKSRSPSDFWGRRWNTLVHRGLKNGVYKPTRRGTESRMWAVLATFVASGLIHEYVNWIMFQHGNMRVDSSVADYKFTWKQMIFFCWNGGLIVLEYAVGDWAIFRWMGQNLPPLAVTALVIGCALPLAHLFTGDWIRHGFFEAIYLVEPIMVCRR